MRQYLSPVLQVSHSNRNTSTLHTSLHAQKTLDQSLLGKNADLGNFRYRTKRFENIKKVVLSAKKRAAEKINATILCDMNLVITELSEQLSIVPVTANKLQCSGVRGSVV